MKTTKTLTLAFAHDRAAQAQLAQSSFGRILLHITCACRDHKFRWHWRGVCRELHF